MKLRSILLLFALAAPGLAWGETLDPPERIARLSYVEGEVTFQAARERATTTLPDRPLIPGDFISTAPGARAELALGTATIRLDEQSELVLVDLDAGAIRVELTRGIASVYLDELLENETFEIATPNATIVLEQPGEYRADVLSDESTALTVHEGAASVETAGGPVRIAAGQRVRLEGRDALARLETPRPADAFDDWVMERELRLAEAEPPRYTPYEGGGYGELDRYGEWYDEPRYGRVWMPGYGYAGWSPYYGGYWQRSGFGWSWFDPAPWGYFTYYSGRWTYLHDRDRWCWVPTRVRPRQFVRDDTRPYWHPRSYPGRETPETAPRTADLQAQAVDESPRVATPILTPRRIDLDRRPTRARESTADERPRGGTPARGANREPRPAAPAAAPPQGGGATMRPSRAEGARSEATPSSSQSRREFGTRRDP